MGWEQSGYRFTIIGKNLNKERNSIMDIRETDLHPWGWSEEGDFLVHNSDDSEEGKTKYPAKRIVCTCCDGRGSTVDPSIDSNGISQDEFDEDPDFQERYFSGGFDIICPHCEGNNVVLYPATEEGEKAYLASQKSEYAYHAECAAERRMGC